MTTGFQAKFHRQAVNFFLCILDSDHVSPGIHVCLFIGRGGVGERVVGSVRFPLILKIESIFIYFLHFGKIEHAVN